jgi:hypothetical protein
METMETPWQVPVTRGAVCLRDGRVLGARTEHKNKASSVLASESLDSGKTWKPLGTVVQADVPDLGDGMFLDSKRHGLLYVYRKNRPPDSFAIETVQSRDGGKTWTPHSVVNAAPRGLWAPFLFETPGGQLLCVYDDENTPLLNQFPGHQWLMGRFWDEKQNIWGQPVTISRAEGSKLSRDGMGSVVSLGKKLICALESVATEPPHPGVIRCVISGDDGATWSQRKTLYQCENFPHMALSSFLIRSGKLLYCIFGTDEAQKTPDKPGTPAQKLHLDIKISVSSNLGQTWSAPKTLYESAHRNYLPGLVALPKDKILALWIDFAKDALLAAKVQEK